MCVERPRDSPGARFDIGPPNIFALELEPIDVPGKWILGNGARRAGVLVLPVDHRILCFRGPLRGQVLVNEESGMAGLFTRYGGRVIALADPQRSKRRVDGRALARKRSGCLAGSDRTADADRTGGHRAQCGVNGIGLCVCGRPEEGRRSEPGRRDNAGGDSCTGFHDSCDHRWAFLISLHGDSARDAVSYRTSECALSPLHPARLQLSGKREDPQRDSGSGASDLFGVAVARLCRVGIVAGTDREVDEPHYDADDDERHELERDRHGREEESGKREDRRYAANGRKAQRDKAVLVPERVGAVAGEGGDDDCGEHETHDAPPVLNRAVTTPSTLFSGACEIFGEDPDLWRPSY